VDWTRDLARHGLEVFREHIQSAHGRRYQDANNGKESEKAWHDGAFGDVW
jgi:hypothetical protein